MAKKTRAAAPAVAVTVANSNGKSAVDRDATPFAVWVGKSAKPKHWAKSQDELVTYLNSVSPSKLKNIHFAQVKQVRATVSVSV